MDKAKKQSNVVEKIEVVDFSKIPSMSDYSDTKVVNKTWKQLLLIMGVLVIGIVIGIIIFFLIKHFIKH